MPSKKNTSDTLIHYVEEYLTEKQTIITKLRPSNIARYISEKYHLNPPLSYYDFTRDSACKELIDRYNSNLSDQYKTSNNTDTTTETYISPDLSAILSASEDKRTAYIIQLVSDANAALLQMQNLLAKNSDLTEKLEKLELKSKKLLNKNDALNEKERTLREEVVKYRKQEKEMSKIIACLQQYIFHYITTPAMQQQLADIGLIQLHAGDTINTPDHIDDLYHQQKHTVDDIIASYESWQKSMDELSDDESKETSTFTPQDETFSNDILSKAQSEVEDISEKLISDIGNL